MDYMLLLLISTRTQVGNRYNNCASKDSILKYYDSLSAIQTENEKIIIKIKSASADANDKFLEATSQLLAILTKIETNLLSPVGELLGSMDSGSSDNFIATLVNCNFISGHLRILYENIHDGLGSNFYNFAIIIETISCSMALGISTFLIVLNRFNKTYSEDQKKKAKLNEELTSMNPEVMQINKPGGSRKSLDIGRIVIKKI